MKYIIAAGFVCTLALMVYQAHANPTSQSAAPVQFTPQAATPDQIIGSWVGTVRTPWVDSYQVQLTFNKDGTYSVSGGWTCGGTSQPGSFCYPFKQSGLYYGTDTDSAQKTYSLTTRPDGTTGGTINVTFSDSVVIADKLVNMIFVGGDDIDHSVLHFEMYHVVHGLSYGPIVFNLKKSN